MGYELMGANQEGHELTVNRFSSHCSCGTWKASGPGKVVYRLWVKHVDEEKALDMRR